ncbi:MAG TPA: hypothetical protein EYP22_10730 [Methanosarcinales archaeon]|nr:hypothetical protein [Methanosarcinales archaeon]
MSSIFIVAFAPALVCATSSVDNKILVYQKGHDLKEGERVKFKDYTIKVHEIKNNIATLLLYKNNNFLQSYKMIENTTENFMNEIKITVTDLKNDSVTVHIYSANIFTSAEILQLSRGDIKNSIKFVKQVKPHYIVMSTPNQNITVTLTITNLADWNLYTYIEDKVPYGIQGKRKEWIFTLEPGMQQSFKYYVNPTSIDNITFPPAIAYINYGEGKYLKLNSSTDTIEVHGYPIDVFKYANQTIKKKGDSAEISVVIKNTGHKTAFVEVRDYVPPELQVSDSVGSSLDWKGVLQPSQSYTYNYTIKLIEGVEKLVLPLANGTYIDEDKNKGTIVSNNLTIVEKRKKSGYVDRSDVTQKPIETIATTPTSTPIVTPIATSATTNNTTMTGWEITMKHIPGFEGFIALIGILLAYLVIREYNIGVF